MDISEIKKICLNGSNTYYKYLASKPNGGVEEIDISKIERINHETFKIKVTKKLFDIESVCFRYNGEIAKTFTGKDIQVKVYDNNKRVVVVKVSQEVQKYISYLVCKDWKLIIDLKFLVQRVIDWYKTNGNKLILFQEKNLNNQFDEGVIFQEENYIPSSEQMKAIQMIFQNYFSYVWGAPGTGKTRFVLSYSILSYIKKEKKVLVLAPTNVALEQVLAGVLEMTDKAKFERKRILRLGLPSQEFANMYGEICEIQGLEKELKRVNDQIKILSSILGIKNNKETKLNQNILILNKVIELNSISQSKRKIQNEISLDLESLQLKKRNHKAKFDTLELEKIKLIEKKNSIVTKIFGFISKKINYDSEIEIIIQKQISLEDLISKSNDSINLNKSQFEQTEIELNLIQKEINDNTKYLKNLGVIGDASTINFTEVLEQLKESLTREIKERQINKSLSDEYNNLSDNQLQQILNKFIEEKEKLEKYSVEIRIESALVIGATIDTFLHRFKEKKIEFSHIFIDEAGYASIVKAMTVFTSKTPVTFLGDHKQLPPVCEISKSDIMKNKDYKEVFVWDQPAIFIGDFWNSKDIEEILKVYLNEVTPSTNNLPKSSLTESFRFGPNLAKVLDKFVYEEGFNSKKTINTEIIVCNVSNPHEYRGRGRLNMAEALAIQNLVLRKYKVGDSISILTPYRDQVKVLKSLLPEFKDENKILTVHKSQGREWDTVIYSVCDIGNGRSPWFTDSVNTLSNGLNNVNTAVSRAKKRLIICCCQQEWLNKDDQLIKGLLDAATKKNDYDSSQFDFSKISNDRTQRKQKFNNSTKRPNSSYKSNSDKKIKSKNYVPLEPDEEWESKLLYWSKLKKSGYTYSSKKDAWWKRK